MNTSKKPLVDQKNSSNKLTKPKKQDANLKYSPTLYFLIGFAVTLFSTYSLFEMNFELKKQTTTITPPYLIEDPYIYNDISYIVEKEKVVVKKHRKSVSQDPIILDVPLTVEPPVFIDVPIDSDNTSIPVSSVTFQEPDEEVEIIFIAVEHVPEYPGCEKGSNTEKRKCMSNKITKFVQRKFNTDLASDLGLTGEQRISVVFKIDKNGSITSIRSRAPHPRLEKEAERVINLLPKMKPGRQRGKAVIVPYSLPIVFQIQD